MSQISSNAQVKYLNYWLLIALSSLLTANILAIFLIVLKIPFFSFPFAQPLFKAVLAYHVNLAMVYWMPTVACWLFCSFFKIAPVLVKWAISCSVMALLLFIVSLVDVENSITLSNYYPILHSTYFVTSLILQVVSVSLLAIGVASKSTKGQQKLYLVKFAALTWLLLVIAIILSLLMADVSFAIEGSLEKLLWAPGHIQQTVNSLLIAAMWCQFLKSEKISPLLGLSSWLALGSCAIALTFSAFSTNELLIRQVYTWQMSLFSWLPMLMVAVSAVKESIANVYVKLSLLVGVLGVIAGVMISSESLSIPGHYHGMTGAFNLAFFALLLNVSIQHSRYQLRLTQYYGFGLVVLIVGLTWAGQLGIGRKLIAQQQGLLDHWQSSAIGLVALGALVAILTSIFIIKSFLPKRLKINHQG